MRGRNLLQSVDLISDSGVSEGATRWEIEVGEIYDLIIAKQESSFQEVGFLPAGEQTVARIRTEACLEVSGYEHIIDTFSVRHILKKHGTVAEFKRGQMPITKLDLVRLPQFLWSPETVENGGRTKQGRDTFATRK
jgi:hypothetical protein